MTNFAILARIKARQELASQKVISVVQEKSQEEEKDLVKIAMKDPETGDVVKEFESIEQAIEEGFNRPNIVGAIKNGNKYKGHLWTINE